MATHRHEQGYAHAHNLVSKWLDDVMLVTHGRRNRGAASYRRGTISLPPYSPASLAWTDAYVLHEVAHWLVRRRFGYGVEAHGREFVRQYMDLLVTEAGFDRAALVNRAYAYGVRF